MGYNRQCPYCGARLDPGEPCDCPRASAERHQDEKEITLTIKIKYSKKKSLSS